MIREWMTDTGNINRYDTVSNRIETLSPQGENIVPVHDITDEEFAEYSSVYPEVSVEITQDIISVSGQISLATDAIEIAISSDTFNEALINDAYIKIDEATSSYKSLKYFDHGTLNAFIYMTSRASYLSVKFINVLNNKVNLVMDHSLKLEGRLDSIERSLPSGPA